MEASILSADLVQRNGFGSALWFSMKLPIAVWGASSSAGTLASIRASSTVRGAPQLYPLQGRCLNHRQSKLAHRQSPSQEMALAQN
jgi:hypothetical protein